MVKAAVGGALFFVLAGLLANCSSSDPKTTPATTDGGPAANDGATPKSDATSSGDSSVATCAPEPVTSFTPQWKDPTPFAQGACTAQMVELLVECSFGDRAGNCDDLEAANEPCFDCLFTPKTAAKWGPIIIDGDLGNVNDGGCVANVTGELGASSCGAKLMAQSQCGSAACDAACPGDDEAALAAYDTCLGEADQTVCAEYADNAACADALIDTGGVAEKCYEGDDFATWAKSVGKLFCAGATSDGGAADATTD